MRADQLIGRLALRERPTNGDKSYMESPVEIVGVKDGLVYYRPEYWSETDRLCSMIGWLDGWKPANCGGKRTVCLMADRFIRLVIKEAEEAIRKIEELVRLGWVWE